MSMPWESFVLVQAKNYTHFVKQPNLKLKTRPKQLLGSLPLAFELPAMAVCSDTVLFITEERMT